MRISDWSSDVCSSDLTLTYSSAIFAEPIADGEPLESAQQRKVRLLLDRLNLKPGVHLLEIGSGWGYLAEVAAREYGAQVESITLSAEQLAFARDRIERAGLTGQEIGRASCRERVWT